MAGDSAQMLNCQLILEFDKLGKSIREDMEKRLGLSCRSCCMTCSNLKRGVTEGTERSAAVFYAIFVHRCFDLVIKNYLLTDWGGQNE